ncbi:MAG TPA: S24/S26 family peptidase [Mycobacteriales bacterium]|jgi:nickel-type superoxide dismutase maturation protease|nr:S24/S26 family peptidase [Mycobacteriales bacterium]
MGLRIATVRGPSMVPALRDGDRVLVRLGAGTPRVGRVVLVELPDRPLSVKRLVAIEPDGSLRVEGDNPFGSTDSRQLGAIPRGALGGTVLARLWPHPRVFRS